MSLRGWRRLSQRVSGWALVLSLVLPGLVSTHDLAHVDPDCDPGFTLGHADTRLATGAPASPVNHCVVCHWLRTAASASPGLAPSPLPDLTTGPSSIAASITSVRDTPRGDLTSRGPPTTIQL